ncbi:MAG: hypothetical protein A3H27_02540 [Acidobacteria bacterium RIFCSPLOWO2_02_FULL_59_13]|nr:MAG: hypothetical protein A3H27_02540 [Acidobacteria bacterium RIFCSPLOWO2_02_FULL_59_13]
MSEQEADVVVVGGGGSGLAAAIEAATLGRSVILVEKNPELGGTTARSVGSITASNTPHQTAAGVKDSPQDHFDDMPLFAAKWMPRSDNEALRRLLTENVPETVRWLMSMGVVFFGPLPEPPHRRPRMHSVLPTSRAYIYFLGRRAKKLGVDIRLATRARRFIVENGAVRGVVCEESSGTQVTLFARGGVVLASGDYSANTELKAKYISPRIASVEPVNPTSTGDGHLMALELGSRVLNGDVFPFYIRFLSPSRKKLAQLLPPWRVITNSMKWALDNLPSGMLRPFVMDFLTTVLAPSPKLFAAGAILVNLKGERFTDETKDASDALVDQPEHAGFIVFDQQIAKKFAAWPYYISTAPSFGYAYCQDYKRSRKDIYHEAATVSGLADKLKVPASTLENTIKQRRNGESTWRSPFHALGPVKILLTLADGGLDVTDRLEVRGKNGEPIVGLFAAGSVGQGGLLLEGHGHHIGWAFTSGRLAGRYAAHRVVSPGAS